MQNNGARVYEATLAECAADLWQARKTVALTCAVCLAAATLFLLTATPRYRAEMVVGPHQQSQVRGLYPLPFEGSAGPAPLPVVEADERAAPDVYAIYEQILRSNLLAERLFADDNIRMRLQQDLPARRAPQNPASLTRYLRDRVHIEPVGASAMRRIVYLHPDPAFAATFLRRLHEETDSLIRSRSLDTVEREHQVLAQAMTRPANPDQRNAMTWLMMQLEHQRVLLTLDGAYAADIIDPPMAFDRPQWPRRGLTLAFALAAGIIAGLVIHAVRRR